MQLYIDNRSGAPIYDQIYSQIKDAILSGQVTEGEALPSIRALAKDLRISVITTKRAYDELEAQGLINTVAGKGCFVAARDLELVREETLRRVEEHLSQAVDLAKGGGVTLEELEQLTLGGLRRAVLEGDVETGSVMSGQVAGMLHEIRPVAEIFRSLYEGGQAVLKATAADWSAEA